MFSKHSGDNPFLVKHLLRRAGFGTTPTELVYYQSLGYDKTLKMLLDPEKTDNSECERYVENEKFDFTRIDELKRWWIYRMTFSKRPLEEKITLFWHGHFATSNQKVGNPYAMYMQNLAIRRDGLGNFRNLLLAMTKDPAMILWLDNSRTRRASRMRTTRER